MKTRNNDEKMIRKHRHLEIDTVRNGLRQAASVKSEAFESYNEKSLLEFDEYKREYRSGATLRKVVIAQSKRVLRKAKANLLADNAEGSGSLFGYPDCCVKKWKEHKSSSENTFVPIESVLDSSNCTIETKNGYKVKPSANPFALPFIPSICLVSHIPCSLNCEESNRIADSRKKIDQNYARNSLKILNSINEIVINEGYLSVKKDNETQTITYPAMKADGMVVNISSVYYRPTEVFQ